MFEANNMGFNSHLPNPNYGKFVPISKDIGDKKEYAKVSTQSLYWHASRPSIPIDWLWRFDYHFLDTINQFELTISRSI